MADNINCHHASALPRPSSLLLLEALLQRKAAQTPVPIRNHPKSFTLEKGGAPGCISDVLWLVCCGHDMKCSTAY